MPKNRQKRLARQHPKGKAARHQKYDWRKSMALFVSIIFISVGLTFLGIAGNAWSRGGYDNFVLAGYWGIAGYLIFGFGAWFTYYSYVIKPAKQGSITQPEDPNRAWLSVEASPYQPLIYDGPNSDGTLSVVFRIANRGNSPANEVAVLAKMLYPKMEEPTSSPSKEQSEMCGRDNYPRLPPMLTVYRDAPQLFAMTFGLSRQSMQAQMNGRFAKPVLIGCVCYTTGGRSYHTDFRYEVMVAGEGGSRFLLPVGKPVSLEKLVLESGFGGNYAH